MEYLVCASCGYTIGIDQESGDDRYWYAPKEPKEIFVMEGATHVDLYDKPQFVSQAVQKLTEFFNKSLG